MIERGALSASLEDYIEAIARLIAEKGTARVRDIARALSVHKSTVTAALKGLSRRGLVNYSPYEVATLTPEGRRVANEIIQSHEVLRRFLADILLVDNEAANENACRMEHAVDQEVLDRLCLFTEFLKTCPLAGDGWREPFRSCVEGRARSEGGVVGRQGWVEECRRTVRPPRREGETEPVMTTTTLDRLKPGQQGTIVRVGSVGALRRRIVDMGVVRGTQIEVIKVAPLGDPLEVRVKGYNLSLRKADAAEITVETGTA